MIGRKMYATATALILGLSAPVLASAAANGMQEGTVGSGPLQLTMQAGVETWSGDVTYQIGYPVTDAWGYTYYGYFPFSELEFPLDVNFAVVAAELKIIDKYAIGLKVKKNVDDPDDHMKDSDWITDSDPWRLDIYSESEISDFDATVIDVDATYEFFRNPNFAFAAGIGYLYQDFEWEANLIRQWSPSGLIGWDYVGDGGVGLIYEAEIEAPYIEIKGSFSPIPALFLNARLAYAPWVQVDDKDQHLLRNKVNAGDLEGTATMVSAGAEYDFTPYLFVNAGFDYTYVEADGDMSAAFYGIYDHTVSEDFDSNQTSVFATIGFRLGVPSQQ